MYPSYSLHFGIDTAQKIKFPILDSLRKCHQIRIKKTADLVSFTEVILNGKIHF